MDKHWALVWLAVLCCMSCMAYAKENTTSHHNRTHIGRNSSHHNASQTHTSTFDIFGRSSIHPPHRKPVKDEKLRALNDLLFPNRTGHAKHRLIRRNLALAKPAYDGSVPCVICRDLKTCSVLNGFQVEEVYYPKNLAYLETCKVIESFGERIANLVFGNGRTFRDTEQCREMVMQYLCLFYGSDNDMYKNYCIYQENVTDPNPANHKVTQRAPCRSFCVQIASVCANDPDHFIQTCSDIRCPPTEDECTPDPKLNGKVLAANLGCSVPYYNSPYFRSAAHSSKDSKTSIITSAILVFLSFIFVLFSW